MEEKAIAYSAKLFEDHCVRVRKLRDQHGAGCWECKHGRHDGMACEICTDPVRDAWDSPYWKLALACPKTGRRHLVYMEQSVTSVNKLYYEDDGGPNDYLCYSLVCIECGEKFSWNESKGDRKPQRKSDE